MKLYARCLESVGSLPASLSISCTTLFLLRESCVINTDLDLASSVSKMVGEHYKEGVEFTTALPSYALICYRKLLEVVCELLAKKFSIQIDHLQLKAKIDRLEDVGKITFGFSDRCQKLRILCNLGAHRPNVLVQGDSKQEASDENEDLLKSALEAREGVLWILRYTYCELLTTRAIFHIRVFTSKLKNGKKFFFQQPTNLTSTGNLKLVYGAKPKLNDVSLHTNT